MDWEVEQKFPIDDTAAFARRLERLGAVLDPPNVQVDRYFAHPARDFAQTDEALRIRRDGPDNKVTYKGPRVDAATKTRREIEIDLPPGPEGAAQFTALFEALGFGLVTEVRKRRRIARIEWSGRQVTLAMDDVDQVGTYVELELLVGEDAVPEARETIASLAAELELTASERRSYLELLLTARAAADNADG